MVATLYINRQGYDCKTQVGRVSKSLENGKKNIEKAKEHLYKVKSSRVTNEISNLTDIYNKDNKYESDFNNFATKLEQCVNDLIENDRMCANKIKQNGQSHRTKNGLPKSLVGAAINASFKTLGNIALDIANGIGKWVDETIESLRTMLSKAWDKWVEDWDSILQMLEGFGGIVAAGSILIAGLFTSATVAPFVMAGAAVALFFGVDKTLSGLIDVMDKEETNGGSLYKNAVKSVFPESKIWGWIVDGVYEAGDTASSILVGGGATAIKGAKTVKKNPLQKLIDKDTLFNIKLGEKYGGDIKFKGKDVSGFIRTCIKDDAYTAGGKLVWNKFKGNFKNIIGDKLIDKGYLLKKESYKNLVHNLQIDHNRAVELASRK